MTTSAPEQSAGVSVTDLAAHLTRQATKINESFPMPAGALGQIAGINPNLVRNAIRFGVLSYVTSSLKGASKRKKVTAEAAAAWLLKLDGGRLAPVYADEIAKSVSTNN